MRLVTINNYSKFEEDTFTNGRDIWKCQSFITTDRRTDDGQTTTGLWQYLEFFSKTVELIKYVRGNSLYTEEHLDTKYTSIRCIVFEFIVTHHLHDLCVCTVCICVTINSKHYATYRRILVSKCTSGYKELPHAYFIFK